MTRTERLAARRARARVGIAAGATALVGFLLSAKLAADWGYRWLSKALEVGR